MTNRMKQEVVDDFAKGLSMTTIARRRNIALLKIENVIRDKLNRGAASDEFVNVLDACVWGEDE
jgi:DNA-binding NarL/FixJ family response regulator